MSGYYDGTKLLSLKDLNGAEPEIYMCTTNRTGGKTAYFNRLVVNKFLKGQGKLVCFIGIIMNWIILLISSLRILTLSSFQIKK
jgi:hypothetical protein